MSQVNRDMWLARVGEHHNTPEYSSYAADANTVMCLPMDMNVLSACMPEMVRLHDMGRFITCVAPTSSFGLLHPKLNALADHNKPSLSVNDVFKVDLECGADIAKQAPLSGRKLVVLSYGPDSKGVAQTLVDQKVDCEMFVINYNRVPNALVNYLESKTEEDLDILLVDQNCNAALMNPVVTELKQKLGTPRNWFFAECTIPQTFIPYGYGEPLLQASDIVLALQNLNVIEGGAAPKPVSSTSVKKAASVEKPKEVSAAGGGGAAAGESVTVKAPMDGEGVYITFHKKVGDAVAADDVIAEVESDKATIEIKAPCAGTVEELLVEEQAEMDVTPDTAIVRLSKAGGGGAAGPSTGGESVTVKAPMDGEGVYISFHKKVGDAVAADEIVAEVESDKATIEIKAPAAGTITKLLVEEQAEMDVTPDTEIFQMEKGAGASASQTSAPAAATKPVAEDHSGDNGDRNVTLSRVELAMVKAMTIDPTDTRTFNQFDSLDFSKVRSVAKEAGVTPPIVMVKHLGEAVAKLDLNKKLSKDRKTMMHKKQVDIGIAVDVGQGLRTCAVRDVTNKSLEQISADVQSFVAAGGKLSPEVTDLKNVAWTVTSIGKGAARFAVSVLPKNTAGILSVGRMATDGGETFISCAMCHATLTGVEGAKLLGEVRDSFN